MSTRRAALLLLALAPALLLPGCLIGRNSKTEVHGTYVGPETIAQIEPGKSASYVVALLGEPSSKTRLDDGGELWKWSYVERKESRGSVLFIFGSNSKHETHNTAFVEFANGAVKRAWRD